MGASGAALCVLVIVIASVVGVVHGKSVLDSTTRGWEIGTFSLYVSDPMQNKMVSGLVHYPITNGTAGGFPLLVFSPGFIFRNTFYDYLWKTLVPLGYVMVVGGTYNYDPYSSPLWKARDQAFFLDYLRNQSHTNKNSPLYGLIGPMSAAMGHSEGGAASLIAADADLLDHKYNNNFTTIVDLSGCFGGIDEDDTIGAKHDNIPILFLTGNKDCICTDSHALYLYDVSPSHCKYYVDLVDGSHCFFADPGPVDKVLCWDLEVLMGCGFVTKLPMDTQLQRILNIAVPWLQWQLKGIMTSKTLLNNLLHTYQTEGKVQYQVTC